MRRLGIAALLAVSALAGAAHAAEDTFTTADIIIPSIQGILSEDCGGYCVVGACAHLDVGWSWRRGVYFYTIVSPRIRHAMPVLLASSYNHPGEEPYAEWRGSFGRVVAGASDALLIAGGREDPRDLDVHQSVSFKEVDIIGHPLASVPDMVDTGGSRSLSSGFKESAPFRAPDTRGSHTVAVDGASADIDVESMASSIMRGMGSDMAKIMARYKDAMAVLQTVSVIDDIRDAATYFKTISQFMAAVSAATEASVRSTIYANLASPRFRVPRLLCPNNIRPLQPYYLSFIDAFWWRAGYPVTDGPISGSDRSGTILNPVSGDTLPVDANPINPLSEVWGNLYPREGTLNQSHDAKTASVIAWRGMDVLRKSVPAPRMGIALPGPVGEDQWSVDLHNPRWQMIYPEVKSCQATPYYPTTDPKKDFMEPNVHGSYAWNYYRTYSCCSNTERWFLLDVIFQIPLCISAAEVFANDDD